MKVTTGAARSPRKEAAAPNRMREQQHLQDIALGEGVDHRGRDDLHQEIDRAVLHVADPVGICRHRGGVQRARVDVHADAGLERIGQDDADQQGEGGDDLEVDHRLDADPADLLQVAGLRDAQHDDAEHDRGDDHLDQLDEPVAKRLQRLGEIRPYGADDDAQYKGHDDLEEKGLVERLRPAV